MGSSLTCKRCGAGFTGRRNALYCGDLCRWQDHSAKSYAMKKNETLQAIEQILEPEMPPRKKGGGLSAKRKGERGEREVCAIISKVTGEEVKRKLGQAREGGGDVDWGPFLLEVKNRATVSMPAWQQQVCEAVEGTGQVPAVVWKRKGEKWWLALPFEEFVQIFNALRLMAQSTVDAQSGLPGGADHE